MGGVDGHRSGQSDIMPCHVAKQVFSNCAHEGTRSVSAALVNVHGVIAGIGPAVVAIDIREDADLGQGLTSVSGEVSGGESDTPVHCVTASANTTREHFSAVFQVLVIREGGQGFRKWQAIHLFG